MSDHWRKLLFQRATTACRSEPPQKFQKGEITFSLFAYTHTRDTLFHFATRLSNPRVHHLPQQIRTHLFLFYLMTRSSKSWNYCMQAAARGCRRFVRTIPSLHRPLNFSYRIAVRACAHAEQAGGKKRTARSFFFLEEIKSARQKLSAKKNKALRESPKRDASLLSWKEKKQHISPAHKTLNAQRLNV